VVTNLVKSPSVSLARALNVDNEKKFMRVMMSLPADHVSSLVDVRDTEEETLDA
jgi:hypothetical protein